MKKLLLLFFSFAFFQSAVAQEPERDPDAEIDPDAYFIDHKTTMGERLIMISKKYMVDPDEIYKYNLVETEKMGIKTGQTLKIPLHKSHKADLDKFKEQLIKKNGGNPIQVESVLPLKKRTVEDEEEEE